MKALRKKNKLTLQQLSEQAGMSVGYISKIERGVANPSANNIQKICYIFGITANELMVDRTDLEKSSSNNKNKSYVLRKEERWPIYGVTNILSFESLYEENPYFKINVLTLKGGMAEKQYSVHNYDEFGIVAKGKLGMGLDDGSYYELIEGECIMIRACTKHTATNCSSEDCVSYWVEITAE